jgi:general secretion pathway protein B
MSSILEALKKLEDEKAARRGGLGNIAGKVTASGRRTRQKPAWLVPAAMAAIAIAAVLGTYTIMGGFSPRHGATVPLTTPAPTSPNPAISLPQAAAPDSAGSAASRTELAAPARRGAHSGASAAAIQTATAPAAAGKRASLLPQPQTDSEPEKAAAPPLPSSDGKLPALNVSGIAWQKDNASRLAVVNGASVTEGAAIAGARVDEIFPDRVRFSYRGKSYEIFLGKTQQDN